jgi:fatty-acyl-CoA synthase
MMKEYWRDPMQTEQIFAGGWLRTGDLARMDEDGYYYLVDRAKDMYISGGENVYPAEVERVLKEFEGVEEAAVIGIPDDRWGEVGCAFVLLKEGVRVSNRAIIAHCRDRLAKYKIPGKIIFCKDFPRTPLGKIRKFLLKPPSED